jgi:hypothetical protein
MADVGGREAEIEAVRTVRSYLPPGNLGDQLLQAAIDALRSSGSAAQNQEEALLWQAREALRYTREYVGEDTLPAIEGWSWYDATVAIDRFLAARSPQDKDQDLDDGEGWQTMSTICEACGHEQGRVSGSAAQNQEGRCEECGHLWSRHRGSTCLDCDAARSPQDENHEPRSVLLDTVIRRHVSPQGEDHKEKGI